MASKRLIALICIAFFRSATAVATPDINFGLGVAQHCQLVGLTKCETGGRAEFVLDLFSKGETRKSVAAESQDESAHKSSGSGSFNLGSFDGGNRSAGDAIVVVAVLVLAVLLTYGIYLAIAALLSSQVSIGLYTSIDGLPISDVEGKFLKDEGDMTTRAGLQATFYPFNGFNFRLHFGAGPASTRVKTITGSSSDYRDAFSSRAGFGFGPLPGDSGVYFLMESEYLSVRAQTFKSLLKQNTTMAPSEARVSQAVLLGYRLSY